MVRPAEPRDTAQILGLIRELAAFERAPDAVEADEERIAGALFGPAPTAFAHVAEEAGEVVGIAVWFRSFSTWLGRAGIYLEDLYVRPAARGRGHGRALLTALGRLAVEHDYGRVEWSVLDWNTSAHAFYRSLGAAPMDEWTVWRLAGQPLRALAGEPAPNKQR